MNELSMSIGPCKPPRLTTNFPLSIYPLIFYIHENLYVSRNVAKGGGKSEYNFVGLAAVHNVRGKISIMSSWAQCLSVYNFVGLVDVHNELLIWGETSIIPLL